jgi:hypothetical protein
VQRIVRIAMIYNNTSVTVKLGSVYEKSLKSSSVEPALCGDHHRVEKNKKKETCFSHSEVLMNTRQYHRQEIVRSVGE